MKTQWLAFMAGIIWLAAGFNVDRRGGMARTHRYHSRHGAGQPRHARPLLRHVCQDAVQERAAHRAHLPGAAAGMAPHAPQVLSRHDGHDHAGHHTPQLPSRPPHVHRLVLCGAGRGAHAGRRRLSLRPLLS